MFKLHLSMTAGGPDWWPGAIGAAALAAILSGCSTGGSPTSTSSSASAAAASAGSPSTSVGISTTIRTPEGYQYDLQAYSARATVTVTVNGQAQTAPPGKTYLAVDVQVRNLVAGRPEPLGPVASSTSTALRLALPKESLAAFGLNPADTQFTCLVDLAPAPTCVLITGTAVASVTPQNASGTPVQLQPGAVGTKVVHLVSSFAVPEAAPLGNVTLFFEPAAGGALTQIPLG